ncbi:MAG: TetR/AcrR family transcriptional regulator [Planctomycetota bacterium]|nr:TetR/AcrR family transcriptional regulator [Planctomycetota bacterium]MDA1179889.1 TetR/AcrR family transcriptional regulator [Planctomycetota bacterium]
MAKRVPARISTASVLPTASVRRRAQERQWMRDHILQSATELLVEQGLERFSMRKLAERIGYTATAIYFHFSDKEALLGAVLDHRFREFRKVFDRLGRQKEPLRRLAQMGQAFVEFGLRQPVYYRLMFLTKMSRIPKGRFVEKGNPSQDCYAYLLATVQEALNGNKFRAEYGDAEQLAQIFFAGVHGIVALHLVKGDDDWVSWRPIRPKAIRMIEALLRGLTVPDDGLKSTSSRAKSSIVRTVVVSQKQIAAQKGGRSRTTARISPKAQSRERS